jgi:hypothetical protein
MTDPGGGHGWRSAPYLPRQRGGVLGLSGRADRALPHDDRPVGVLLLPQPLETFWLRDRAEDLLTAPAVVAVDPARVSYRALARLPEAVAAGLAAGQSRRMRVPGTPRAIVLFHPLQYPLARSLVSDHPDAELWYAEWEDDGDTALSARMHRRLGDLDTMAALRADLRFDARPADGPARERNRQLWERLEGLGVESGRLGSERADVIRAWGGAGPSA